MKQETNEFGYTIIIPDPSIEGYEDIIDTILSGMIAHITTKHGPEVTYNMLDSIYKDRIMLYAVDEINKNLPPEADFKVNGRMVKGIVAAKAASVREELEVVLAAEEGE